MNKNVLDNPMFIANAKKSEYIFGFFLFNGRFIDFFITLKNFLISLVV